MLAKITQNDCRTIHGLNLMKIPRECEVEPANLSTFIVKSTMRYSKVPQEETWRLQVLKELLSVRFGETELNNFEENEINAMIDMLCLS